MPSPRRPNTAWCVIKMFLFVSLYSVHESDSLVFYMLRFPFVKTTDFVWEACCFLWSPGRCNFRAGRGRALLQAGPSGSWPISYSTSSESFESLYHNTGPLQGASFASLFIRAPSPVPLSLTCSRKLFSSHHFPFAPLDYTAFHIVLKFRINTVKAVAPTQGR